MECWRLQFNVLQSIDFRQGLQLQNQENIFPALAIVTERAGPSSAPARRRLALSDKHEASQEGLRRPMRVVSDIGVAGSDLVDRSRRFRFS